MTVWAKKPEDCNHEGTERFSDYKDGFKIEWCGDCGTETSRTPDPNQLSGQARRDDMDVYFKTYANEAKNTGGIAILSYRGWIEEGRPTFAAWREQFNKPKPQTPEGVTTNMTDTNTAATGTATATKEKNKEKKARPAGAKALVREIFTTDPNAELSLEELSQRTGKPASSITTAISDLRSAKYCKPGDPLKLNRHKNGKYSLKEVVEEAAPAQTATETAPATTVTEGEALPA